MSEEGFTIADEEEEKPFSASSHSISSGVTPAVQPAAPKTETAKPSATGKPLDYRDGVPPANQSAEELRTLQEAQAAHAFNIQVDNLARQFPVVAELVAQLAAAKAKLKKK